MKNEIPAILATLSTGNYTDNLNQLGSTDPVNNRDNEEDCMFDLGRIVLHVQARVCNQDRVAWIETIMIRNEHTENEEVVNNDELETKLTELINQYY